MTAQKLLNAQSIKLESYAPGRHYATCPLCSKVRRKQHQANKVLGITIDANGAVRWGCNHCGWTGPEKDGDARGSNPELPNYIYRDRDGVVRFRKVRNQPGRDPRFWLEQPNGDGWKKGTKGVDTTILYRADEVAKAIAAGRPIAVVEGERDADNCWRLDIPATCNAHGASMPDRKPKWTEAHSAQLQGADIVVFNDNDAPGYAHADTICKLSLSVAKRVRRLDLKPHWPEIPKGGDISDWLAAGGEYTSERLRELIASAPDAFAENPAPSDDAAEVERLARLSLFEFERGRKAAAEKLGVRAPMLDKLIVAKRAELGLEPDDDGIQGRAVEYEEPEPWPDTVDGAKLLDDLAVSARRFTILPPDAAEVSALWATHTYLLDATDITPRLQLSSPTKGCGKTTFLDWLSEVVYRADLASNISASALFRTVEKWRPTLLLDEADSFLFENEAMRNVLNSGHHVKGTVKISVKVGDNYEPRIFSTFAPVAFGLIGELKGALATVNDRSIRIVLQRRKPDEKIESLSGPRRRDEFKPLRQRLMRWAPDHRAAIAQAEPKIPEGLYNRIADNWRPLFAIADAAGGEWPMKARAIAMRAAPSEEQTAIEMLIADIWDLFDATSSDLIPSEDLVGKLIEKTDRPWPEFGKTGKPITQAKLARLLKQPGLGISPKPIRVTDDEGHEKQVRGYERSQFDDAFSRFVPEKGLPKCHSVTSSDETPTSDLFELSQPTTDVTLRKSQKPNNDGLCDAVTPWCHSAQPKRLSDVQIEELRAWTVELDWRHRGQPEVVAEALHERLRNKYDVRPGHLETEAARVMDAVFSKHLFDGGESKAETYLEGDLAPDAEAKL